MRRPPFVPDRPSRARSLVLPIAVLCGVGSPTALAAQSDRALAAWNAIMLTPVGALPPLTPGALDRSDEAAPLTIALQYGAWRYNADDVTHYNAGLTLGRRLGSGTTELLLTGMVITPPCGSCSAWGAGAVELRSTLWRPVLRQSWDDDDGEDRASGLLGMRLMAAGARYRGATYAAARSATAAMSVGATLRVVRGVRLTAAALPGLGFGSITSDDQTGRGLRATLGTTLSATLGRYVALAASSQHVYITGGPTQYGLSLAWRPW